MRNFIRHYELIDILTLLLELCVLLRLHELMSLLTVLLYPGGAATATQILLHLLDYAPLLLTVLHRLPV